VRAIVHGARPSDRDLAGRSLRALRLFGVSASDAIDEPWPRLLARIRAEPGPVWLVRAGAFPMAPVTEPPPSATGRPIVALGQVLPAEGSEALAKVRWPDGPGVAAPAPPLSAWLDARVAASLCEAADLDAALRAAVLAIDARVVAFPGLDVRDDQCLRIAEVVTSAQQGGAERIALDLARGLRDHGLKSRLVLLGRPTRAAFDVPEDAIDLSRLGGPDPDHRARRVARYLVSEGFDLVHGHLLDESTVRAFAARGLLVALTIHNMPASWPTGTRRLRRADVQLLIGCAQVVERELADLVPGIPARTVWNGVDFRALSPDAERHGRARSWREGLGFDDADFVLLALANARPQKRLHLLPAILRATKHALGARGLGGRARLVIAGAPSARSPHGERAVRQLDRAIDACGVREDVRLVGSTADVAACLLGSDVLISASAHEGLSLAQIEALFAGRPVVTTNVGGASEIAVDNPAVHLIDREAPPAEFARALGDIASRPAMSGAEPARRHFDVSRMVEGYARLLPRALRQASRRGEGTGLWLVTNNFSTGGAQTSARRLLLGLRERGIMVRAAVVEEQPAFPTPGRRALIDAGVRVLALPDPATEDAPGAVSHLIEAMDLDPPEAVLFWNLRPDYKLLVVDALLDTPVFDVSPGEMFFSSFERHFEKPRAGLPYRTFRDYGRRLAGVIVKYEGERERAHRLLGAPAHVIQNGVPAEDERSPRPVDGPIVIGTAARLDPRKHVDRLLRALRLAHDRLPPYVLRIAGGEEPGFSGYASELRSLARSMPVKFVGELTDTRAFLRDLDVFALVAEPAGCPNASLEAMAQGLPVVATDVGGMSEQVEDGITGRLVGREDEEALASALVELASDPRLRRAMGTAGRERVRRRFGLQTMVDRYAAVCLGRRASSPGPM
jgi:glycosyltransferase involved in cell wall biosynthesis